MIMCFVRHSKLHQAARIILHICTSFDVHLTRYILLNFQFSFDFDITFNFITTSDFYY